MRISDWSSDVCSSDLLGVAPIALDRPVLGVARAAERLDRFTRDLHRAFAGEQDAARGVEARRLPRVACLGDVVDIGTRRLKRDIHVGDLCLHRSEEHTSELQSLMRNSYAVFFLKKKTKK